MLSSFWEKRAVERRRRRKRIGRLDDWAIGRLDDWMIGRLDDLEWGKLKWNFRVFILHQYEDRLWFEKEA
jgi:hypothetical protein